jgi:hypothetical protein
MRCIVVEVEVVATQTLWSIHLIQNHIIKLLWWKGSLTLLVATRGTEEQGLILQVLKKNSEQLVVDTQGATDLLPLLTTSPWLLKARAQTPSWRQQS